MPFELSDQSATLTSVTPRTEMHGEDRVFAISLGLSITGGNTLLDNLSPKLRDALYEAVEGQEQLPGVEPSTPKLRCNLVDQVTVRGSLEGWTIAVDHGIDEHDPITLGGCKVDKFRVSPSEGGSVDLTFRVGSNDIDAEEAGLLCSHLGQQVQISLTAPKVREPAIDGTTAAFQADNPGDGGQSAEDLFSAQHGGPRVSAKAVQ
jgi:hypothetical protein